MEGDYVEMHNALKAIMISTHALTWRATDKQLVWVGDRNISTHALTWRATWGINII